MAGLVLGAGGMLIAQQDYPNISEPEVVLDNERVVVQRVEFQPGAWSGEHSHEGNQLVVLLDDVEMLYRSAEGENTVAFERGHVYWVDAVTHDHRTQGEGTGLLITLK